MCDCWESIECYPPSHCSRRFSNVLTGSFDQSDLNLKYNNATLEFVCLGLYAMIVKEWFVKNLIYTIFHLPYTLFFSTILAKSQQLHI